ncbi:MAG: S8 family serine peptidase [Oscillospiraceae bacterium]|nr:S8 family serine peptidase [Oscillospiraceae bacterium]
MKQRVLTVLLVFVFIIICINPIATQAFESQTQSVSQPVNLEEKIFSTATLEDDFTEDCVLVVLTNTASLECFDYGVADFPEIDCTDVINLSSAMTERVESYLAGENIEEKFGAEETDVVPQDFYDVDIHTFHQILLLKIANGSKEKVLTSIKALEPRVDILYVGPDYTIPLDDNIFCVATPNDTYAGAQWAIDNIDLRDAWNICIGNNSVTVGVIDSGIDATHEEMLYKIDVGKSVLCNDDRQYQHVQSVTDPSGHGTMVAGIIGAFTNNQKGISGVNWNVKLASLSIWGDHYDDDQNHWNVMAALDAATALNIPIVNISLSTPTYEPAFLLAVQNYPGLIVCAAGNLGQDLESNPRYPAVYSGNNIITVGASTMFNAPCEWSNFGNTEVDLFAPGATIITSFPRYFCDQPDNDPNDDKRPCEANASIHYDTGYHVTNGTSFSTPYVTGVAALIMAEYPNLTVAEVKTRILYSVDVSSSFVGKCATDGRLNAYKALHNHTLTVSCEYIDTTHHKGYCVCGAYDYVTHTWAEMDDYWYCTGCGYRQY